MPTSCSASRDAANRAAALVPARSVGAHTLHAQCSSDMEEAVSDNP